MNTIYKHCDSWIITITNFSLVRTTRLSLFSKFNLLAYSNLITWEEYLVFTNKNTILTSQTPPSRWVGVSFCVRNARYFPTLENWPKVIIVSPSGRNCFQWRINLSQSTTSICHWSEKVSISIGWPGIWAISFNNWFWSTVSSPRPSVTNSGVCSTSGLSLRLHSLRVSPLLSLLLPSALSGLH